MKITREWLKPQSPCEDGYRWFLAKFPQGGEFGDVYAALRAARRYSDAGWLAQRAFASMTGSDVAASLVSMTGADPNKIKSRAAETVKVAGTNTATGDDGHAAATGYAGHAAATGYAGHAAATGDDGHAAATGYAGHAAATGYDAIAVAFGIGGRAMAGENGAVVVVWRDSANRRRLTVGYVGEAGIEPNVWYCANDAGDLVKADE